MVKKKALIEVEEEDWKKLRAIAIWNGKSVYDVVGEAFKWYIANVTANGSKGLDAKIIFALKEKKNHE